MVRLQRAVAERSPVVMAGRDIGTRVLTDARAKIFLAASIEVRARRRLAEELAAGRETDLERVIEETARRDGLDQTGKRAIHPGAGGAGRRDPRYGRARRRRGRGARPRGVRAGERLVTGWVWDRFSIFAYWIATSAVYWFIRTFARLEVVDASNVPAEGRVLIVANHLSNFDPVLVAACAPRRVRTMAKREMFETPLVGWTVWAYGAFPVRRHSADMGALRVGRNHLVAGRAVLVFPEGTRAPERSLIPALPGSAMLALLGDAPVVPVAVTGTEQAERSRRDPRRAAARAAHGARALRRAVLARRGRDDRQPRRGGDGPADAPHRRAAAGGLPRRLRPRTARARSSSPASSGLRVTLSSGSERIPSGPLSPRGEGTGGVVPQPRHSGESRNPAEPRSALVRRPWGRSVSGAQQPIEVGSIRGRAPHPRPPQGEGAGRVVLQPRHSGESRNPAEPRSALVRRPWGRSSRGATTDRSGEHPPASPLTPPSPQGEGAGRVVLQPRHSGESRNPAEPRSALATPRSAGSPQRRRSLAEQCGAATRCRRRRGSRRSARPRWRAGG